MWGIFKRKPVECYFFFVFKSMESAGVELIQTRGVIDTVRPNETSLDAVERIVGRMKGEGDVANGSSLVSLSICPARP